MNDYTPIDCGLYSLYEQAILRRKPLRLSWREPDGQLHVEVVLPKDLQTRNQAEFLIAEDSRHNPLRVRLDHIVRSENL